MSWKEKYGREDAKTKTLANSKPKSGNGNRIKIGDVLGIHTWTKKEWDNIRLIGPLHSYGFHTVTTYGKDGTKYEFQKQCLKYNPETEERDLDTECPYCDADYKFRPTYFHNAIDRNLQENEPRKPNPPTKAELRSGFKDKESSSWTPVVVLRMPPSLVTQLINLGKLNKKGKGGETYPISDIENGRDVAIMFDPDGTGDGMYKPQLGSEATPITDDEAEYLIWNLEDCIKPETVEEAEAEIARFAKACAEHGGEDGEEESESRTSRSKKSRHEEGKPAARGKKAPPPDDDDDDDAEAPELPDEGDRVTVTDKDGDEVAVGVITTINTKKVTVETDDGEEESFFLSRVTLTPAPAKKGKGKKAPEPEPEEEEDEDTPEFSEGDRVQVLDEEDGDEVAVGTIESIDTKKVTVEDDDGDQHTFKFSAGFTLKAAPAKKGKGKGKKAPEPEPEEEEDDEPSFEEGDRVKVTDNDDEDEVVIGTVTEINAKKVVIEDDDGESHTFKLSTVTLTSARKAAAAKGKKAPPPDDDDDEVKPAPKGKKKPAVEPDDEDDVRPAKKPAAGKKKFSFDDDDED